MMWLKSRKISENDSQREIATSEGRLEFVGVFVVPIVRRHYKHLEDKSSEMLEVFQCQ